MAVEQVETAPLTIIRTLDGFLRLECNTVRMESAQVLIQSGIGMAAQALITIPLDHIELLTERDAPLQ